VRVVPRARRAGVETTSSGIVIKVHAAPEGGRATEEARRALAEALGVARSEVVLRRGRRSREKMFEVRQMTRDEALQRLQAR
jgi:uncharacterized protein YggU (UPF0235/DUF167 family)